MIRLGISDPKTFIKKHFKSEPIVYLKRVCVGSGLIDQTEASIEEAMSTDGYADVTVSLLSGSILLIFLISKSLSEEKGNPLCLT